MAFRVVRQRREARRNAKMEEIFMVRFISSKIMIFLINSLVNFYTVIIFQSLATLKTHRQDILFFAFVLIFKLFIVAMSERPTNCI